MLDPLAKREWTPTRAAHLLNRAGFGGPPKILEEFAGLGLASAVDYLVNYEAIRSELVQYNEQLGSRPELVAVTKCELPGAEQVRERLAKQLGREVLLVSAVTGKGLNQLTAAIARLLDEVNSP